MKRRKVLGAMAAAGAAVPALGRAVAALAEEKGMLTPEMIGSAEWLTGLRTSDAERALMLEDVNESLEQWAALRAVELDNAVPPALVFDPAVASVAPPREDARAAEAAGAAGAAAGTAADRSSWTPPEVGAPGSADDVAFASVAQLAAWLRRREVSSRELTELYLDRLQKHDPRLECVITLTEERARKAADAADARIAAGEAHGPLDGIPWGAKDLLAVPGYRTTWGAKPYEHQTRQETADVVGELDRAGSPLLAKLTVGALAWGDVWFGGKTRNPWNTEQGSSGSSAGPAAATAAGLVGFAIGTETWGSIVSPSTRCGVSGLRPTFGRVSRYGCMALSWSMDKIGPIARSLDDCAWIFDAVRVRGGRGARDPATRDRPFDWPPRAGAKGMRVGFVPALFDEDRAADVEDDAEDADRQRADAREWADFDRRTLRELEGLGVELVPVELPADPPVAGLALILTAEAATAFDALTRSGRDDLLVRQERYAWPNVFRQGQMIPAVEYLRANRIRTLLLRDLEALFRDERLDAYVTPTFGGDNLLLTNLTGHPQIVMPNGFRTSDGTPTSITVTGRLFGESGLLALGAAHQEATGYHRRRPPL